MTIAERLSSALADRYRIERELGQGGMATVYLAEDLKHGRKVALKVLKPELAAVLGADRFIVEIRTTAALQHPHILPLFDSGTADGFLYYVMPFIEGETLRDKLNRETQLGVAEAVQIAVDVAGALDYAHRHRVIHRDIKPENILLHDGRPIVADFGIALAVSAAAGGRMTETGLSLGTPHYMSPEQATAEKEISARSDVYSLASVLYEMLAGQPPHLGGSAQQIIMKIIAEPVPAVTTLRKSVPPDVAASIGKALEKLPADRFASAHEFAEALQGRVAVLTTGAASMASARGGMRRRLRDPLVVGLAALLVATVALAGWQWTRNQPPGSELAVRFAIDLPRTVSEGTPLGSSVAISSDGSTLAYIGGALNSASQQIFVRSVDDVQARPVRGTEGALLAFLSPDGKWLGFWTKGRLQKVALDGSAPVQLGEIATVLGASWSSKGVIIASVNGKLMTIPDTGGAFLPLIASPDADTTSRGFPVVLDDGETVLFTRLHEAATESYRFAVASLSTGVTRGLDVVGTFALGVVDGNLIYATSTNQLMAIAFDVQSARVTGSPIQVGTTMSVGMRGAPMAAVSGAGALAYQSGSGVSDLVLVDRRGGMRALLPESRVYSHPRFSPDGKRVAITIQSNDKRDVWVHDRDGQTLTKLTDDGWSERPEWTPNGKSVLFRTQSGPTSTGIWWRPADMSVAASPLVVNTNDRFFEAVMTPDGTGLVLQRAGGIVGNGADIVYRSVSGDTATYDISATRAEEAQARPSPDGQWVAFQSTASGINQVIVRPLKGPDGQVVVSTGFGTEPVWSPDGEHLYYRDGIQFVEVTYRTTPAFTVTSRNPLFGDLFAFAPLPHANYDVSPDGATFMMLRPTQGTQLVFVHNWRAELRRLLASRPRR